MLSPPWLLSMLSLPYTRDHVPAADNPIISLTRCNTIVGGMD